MRRTIGCALLLLMSTWSMPRKGKRSIRTRIKFENERLPTGGAGIGACMDVIREGDALFVLQGRSLTILSLDDPARPKVVGNVGERGNLRRLWFAARRRLLPRGKMDCFVVDVSDRTSRRSRAVRYD